MTTASDLHRTVQATLDSKRLGRPVFVRYTLQGKDPAAAVLPRLAQTLEVIRNWLGQPLATIYATGSVESGQVSLTLQFTGGASAQVSYARTEPRGDGVDLMVIGNHGAIYHDAGSAELWDEVPKPDDARPDPAILKAIEQSLQTTRPQPLEQR